MMNTGPRKQRDNVEAGTGSGKHLAFFSGNEVYWKTRWENSVDGTRYCLPDDGYL